MISSLAPYTREDLIRVDRRMAARALYELRLSVWQWNAAVEGPAAWWTAMPVRYWGQEESGVLLAIGTLN